MRHQHHFSTIFHFTIFSYFNFLSTSPFHLSFSFYAVTVPLGIAWMPHQRSETGCYVVLNIFLKNTVKGMV